jgi:cbb3-type cytochrome c oxidase subunit III
MQQSSKRAMSAGALGLAALLALSCAAMARRAPLDADGIWANPALREQAVHAGKPVFVSACAGCHGTDGRGAPGAHASNLADDRWLYGGEDIDTFIVRASDIERTVLHGIRADDPEGRNWPEMPARGVGHSLEPGEISAITEYVLKLAGKPHDPAQIAAGKEAFEGEGGCYDCHTLQGWGDTATGAADLTRPQTWLYGTDRAAIAQSITEGRKGVSPAFEGKLTPAEVRAVSVYVLSLAKTRKSL